MFKTIFLYVAAGVFLLACLAFTTGAQERNGSAGEGYHVQKGLEYYGKGFYEFAPKGQQEEAGKNYQLAVDEFKKAIAMNPASEDAHRNLARVF